MAEWGACRCVWLGVFYVACSYCLRDPHRTPHRTDRTRHRMTLTLITAGEDEGLLGSDVAEDRDATFPAQAATVNAVVSRPTITNLGGGGRPTITNLNYLRSAASLIPGAGIAAHLL